MGDTFVVERAVLPSDGSTVLVIVNEHFGLHPEASAYLAWLRAAGRSSNTERVYAGRIALFLTYCSSERLEWKTLSNGDLTTFLIRLVAEPVLPDIGRGGRNSPYFRSPKTANAILTSVSEFMRFAATREWIAPEVVQSLNCRQSLRDRPPGYDWGERQQFRTIQARSFKLPQAETRPRMLGDNQIAAVFESAQRPRDRLLFGLLAESGIRIGEALGLRREDMHFLSSSAALGCSTVGPHVHIRRRLNANGALAKSRYERSIPVTSVVSELYSTYQRERYSLVDEDTSDFVFVNLYRPPIGAPMRYHNVKKLFERTSAAVGYPVTPHMFRHSAAARWLSAGVSRDVVQSLLGHVSAASMQIYRHPPDEAMGEAVKTVGPSGRSN